MTQTIALAIIYLFIQRGPSRAVLTYSVAHRLYERGVRSVCVYARARLDLYVWMCMHGDISAARASEGPLRN